MKEAVSVFYSYSRKDLPLLKELDKHLAGLKAAKRISSWHDLDLEAGSEWELVIKEKLDTSDVILLLVSANFIASEYCYSIELERAIERHKAGEARVIPVILSPCDWKNDYVPFSKLTALPNHDLAVTQWENREEAFATVAQGIRKAVEILTQK